MNIKVRAQCSYCGKINNTHGKTYVLCSWCGHRVYNDTLLERRYRRKHREEYFEKTARHELIKARKESGITLREVSEKSNYSEQTIYRAEHGTLYLKDGTKASDSFFTAMETIYGISKEVLRKRGK